MADPGKQNAPAERGAIVDLAGGLESTNQINQIKGKFSTNIGDSAASFVKEVV